MAPASLESQAIKWVKCWKPWSAWLLVLGHQNAVLIHRIHSLHKVLHPCTLLSYFIIQCHTLPNHSIRGCTVNIFSDYTLFHPLDPKSQGWGVWCGGLSFSESALFTMCSPQRNVICRVSWSTGEVWREQVSDEALESLSPSRASAATQRTVQGLTCHLI